MLLKDFMKRFDSNNDTDFIIYEKVKLSTGKESLVELATIHKVYDNYVYEYEKEITELERNVLLTNHDGNLFDALYDDKRYDVITEVTSWFIEKPYTINVVVEFEEVKNYVS